MSIFLALSLMLTLLLAFHCEYEQRKQSLEKMNGISSARESESIRTESGQTGLLFPVIGKQPVQTKQFTVVRETWVSRKLSFSTKADLPKGSKLIGSCTSTVSMIHVKHQQNVTGR